MENDYRITIYIYIYMYVFKGSHQTDNVYVMDKNGIQ